MLTSSIAKWRLLYGTTGILDFYLRVVATHGVNNEILLHALRLIGNSCADTGKQLFLQWMISTNVKSRREQTISGR